MRPFISRIIQRDLNDRKGPFRPLENSQVDQTAYANCAINQLIELQVWPNNTVVFEQTKRRSISLEIGAVNISSAIRTECQCVTRFHEFSECQYRLDTSALTGPGSGVEDDLESATKETW